MLVESGTTYHVRTLAVDDQSGTRKPKTLAEQSELENACKRSTRLGLFLLDAKNKKDMKRRQNFRVKKPSAQFSPDPTGRTLSSTGRT